MRRRLFAALLASTFLTPAEAQAAPVAAFFGGLLSTVGVFTPVAGGFLGAYTAGIYAGGFFLGSALGRTLLGFGLSALAASFAPAPNFNVPEPSATMGNFAQPVSYASWLFGRVRTGGPIAFTQASDRRRFYVVIVAAHECEGVVEHWLDEYTVGIDATATSFSDANLLTSGDDAAYTAPDALAGAGRIEAFLGDPSQTANAGLMSVFDEVTSEFDFAGLAGAVVWARKVSPEKFTKTYPNGRQWAWTPVMDGNNQIWDPRDETYKFSANAALCLAYWITEILGGSVDWDEVAAEADVCDETVTTAEGETIARWEINGRLGDELSFETQRAQMAGACDAFLYERADGKVGFKVGRWIAPTVTLSAADFSACEVVEGQWGADAPTEVVVQYIEPENAWRETPSGVWVEDATARRVRDEPRLYMVRYHNQAARLAKRIAKARRPKYQLRGTIGLAGYELIGQRFFTFLHAGLGFTQSFEVGALRRVNATTFEIEAVSVDQTDFDFDAAAEEPKRPEFGSFVSEFEVPNVENISIDATSNSSITVSFDALDEGVWVEIRWRALSTSEWQQVQIQNGATEYLITGLSDGTTYEVQLRSIEGLVGTLDSEWLPSPAAQVTTVGNAVAPNALASFATSVVGSDVLIEYTTANDGNHHATRVYRNSSATFGTATLIHTDYAGPNTASSYTDTSPGPGTWYYWAVPENASGLTGTASGPESETL